MKLHRAVTLVLMIVFSLLLIAYGIATFSSGSLAALVVVLVAAAVAGILFSWRRYFPGRR